MASATNSSLSNGNVLLRSPSVDSAIFDGGEDSPDDFDEIEEQSFEEINDEQQETNDNSEQQLKLIKKFFSFLTNKYFVLI